MNKNTILLAAMVSVGVLFDAGASGLRIGSDPQSGLTPTGESTHSKINRILEIVSSPDGSAQVSDDLIRGDASLSLSASEVADLCNGLNGLIRNVRERSGEFRNIFEHTSVNGRSLNVDSIIQLFADKVLGVVQNITFEDRSHHTDFKTFYPVDGADSFTILNQKNFTDSLIALKNTIVGISHGAVGYGHINSYSTSAQSIFYFPRYSKNELKFNVFGSAEVPDGFMDMLSAMIGFESVNPETPSTEGKLANQAFSFIRLAGFIEGNKVQDCDSVWDLCNMIRCGHRGDRRDIESKLGDTKELGGINSRDLNQLITYSGKREVPEVCSITNLSKFKELLVAIEGEWASENVFTPYERNVIGDPTSCMTDILTNVSSGYRSRLVDGVETVVNALKELMTDAEEITHDVDGVELAIQTAKTENYTDESINALLELTSDMAVDVQDKMMAYYTDAIDGSNLRTSISKLVGSYVGVWRNLPASPWISAARANDYTADVAGIYEPNFYQDMLNLLP